MRAQANLFGMVIATAIIMAIAALGILWYAVQSADEVTRESSAAFIAGTLPEWQCSYKGDTTTGCIDLLRVGELGGDYFSSLGYSVITLEYLDAGSTAQITVYENKKELFSDKKISYFPVSVYDAGREIYMAGKMKAEVYT